MKLSFPRLRSPYAFDLGLPHSLLSSPRTRLQNSYKLAPRLLRLASSSQRPAKIGELDARPHRRRRVLEVVHNSELEADLLLLYLGLARHLPTAERG